MRKQLLFGTLILIATSMTASAQAQCPLEARVSRIEGRLDELTYAVETLLDRLTPEKDRRSVAPLAVQPRSRPTPAARGDAASSDETDLQISDLQRRVAGLIEIARRRQSPRLGALSLRHKSQLAELESQVETLEKLLTADHRGQHSRLIGALATLDRNACQADARKKAICTAVCTGGNCVRGTDGSCTCSDGRTTCINCQDEPGNACPPQP